MEQCGVYNQLEFKITLKNIIARKVSTWPPDSNYLKAPKQPSLLCICSDFQAPVWLHGFIPGSSSVVVVGGCA